MDEKPIVRDFKEGDEDDINSLFMRVFKRERTLDQWRWKHIDNPFGRSIMRVAELNSNIRAHGSWMPIPMKIEGREILSYQGVDAMTHPDFRERGEFNRIQSEVTDNIDTVMYASARKKLLSLYQKIVKDLVTVGLVHKYRKMLRYQGLKGKVRGVMDRLEKEREVSSSIEKIDFFNSEFDELWRIGRVRNELMIVRNSKYLNWRYAKEPGKRYSIFKAVKDGKLVGYSVLTTHEGEGYLLDIFTTGDREVEADLVLHSIEHFRDRGMKSMICYMNDEQLESILDEQGFTTDWGFFLIVKSGTPDVPKDMLGNKSKWYFTYGDIDAL